METVSSTALNVNAKAQAGISSKDTRDPGGISCISCVLGVMISEESARGDSHFVGHVKHQRGDRDEDQAHPEDARAEHHVRLSHTHTRTHKDTKTHTVTLRSL